MIIITQRLWPLSSHNERGWVGGKLATEGGALLAGFPCSIIGVPQFRPAYNLKRPPVYPGQFVPTPFAFEIEFAYRMNCFNAQSNELVRLRLSAASVNGRHLLARGDAAVYPQQRRTEHEVCMASLLCGQDKKSMGAGLTARRRSGYGAHVSHEQYATVAA